MTTHDSLRRTPVSESNQVACAPNLWFSYPPQITIQLHTAMLGMKIEALDSTRGVCSCLSGYSRYHAAPTSSESDSRPFGVDLLIGSGLTADSGHSISPIYWYILPNRHNIRPRNPKIKKTCRFPKSPQSVDASCECHDGTIAHAPSIGHGLWLERCMR